MPGVWLWLLLLSIVLLITFAIVFEFLGAKWYSWLILGLGLVFYFFSIIAYIFRSKKCHKHATSADITENVMVVTPVANTTPAATTNQTPAAAINQTPAPIINTTAANPAIGQLHKPSRRVGIIPEY